MEKLEKYLNSHGYISTENFFMDDHMNEFIKSNFSRDEMIIELSKLMAIYSELGNYNLIYNLTVIIRECIHGNLFNKEIIHEIFERNFITSDDYEEFKRRVFKEDNEVISCVYKITCKANGKFYIGSTNDLIKRRIIHRFELKFERHFNKFLQADFDLYGDENFVFKVVERVSSLVTRNDLYKLEQKYMDELNPQYNIIRKVTYKNSDKVKFKNKISFGKLM
jgi:hypothetical protein